ncbi:helix-turn-helix domain-containing protein [Salipaludibacillus daqingensis]|uniref:helix-turn-helix domain-containing protein n=1 Tax=Salipaludibacillus daqingensis TaxID=3041001 RepID=UPI00247512F4|nr:helix-turn-helix domain-containing protein [Salipaludibacillus daqingensis]
MINGMTSLHYIILQTTYAIQGDRTINGIIHILRGKRSAQTIQDISLFQLEQSAAILKNEPKKYVDAKANELLENGWIVENSDRGVNLSTVGNMAREKLLEKYNIPDTYHGLKYEWNHSSYYFWEQLSLLVQTISYLKDKQSAFIPVSYDRIAQNKVKQLLQKYHDIDYIGDQVYQEIERVLSNKTEKEATLFVNRLTSNFRTGRTFDQLSSIYYGDRLYTSIVFRSTLHDMIAKANEDRKNNPILSYFQIDRDGTFTITQTSTVTKKLFEEGYSLDEIAKRRNLKHSTIEDHVIELAIHDPNFNFDSFITGEQLQEIEKEMKRLNTRKLKPIKDEFGDKYTYFQIRLAISSYKGEWSQ